MYNERRRLDLEICCRHARDTLPSPFAYNKRVFTMQVPFTIERAKS